MSKAFTKKYESTYGAFKEQTNATLIFKKKKEEEKSLQKYHLFPGRKSMPEPLHSWYHSKWCSQYKCLIVVFPKHRPSGPMLYKSQNVRLCIRLFVCLSVCLFVCLYVCLFTIEVPFKRLFAPTSWSWHCEIFGSYLQQHQQHHFSEPCFRQSHTARQRLITNKSFSGKIFRSMLTAF